MGAALSKVNEPPTPGMHLDLRTQESVEGISIVMLAPEPGP